MLTNRKSNWLKLSVILFTVCLAAGSIWKTFVSAAGETEPEQTEKAIPAPAQETPVEGCLECHKDIEPMHKFNSSGEVFETLKDGKDALGLNCTSCHGGNPGTIKQEEAHVQPKYPDEWGCKDKKCSSRNPERTNTLLAKESREFVRFINPSDFRVIKQSCGECHSDEGHNVSRSMMAHGSMLWGAALYNNGGFPLKDSQFGESYNEDGNPRMLFQNPQPTREQQAFKGLVPFLSPLPRWEISQPGNILRVFERGGRRRLEVGLPDKEEENGKPDKGLSPRGLGTGNRTDPVYLGLQKTRLLDPTLNFLGTNDHPGDYRSSGCASCHVIYANDRSPFASDFYASAGNEGKSQSADKTIPKNESGHPIKHQFTSKIPTSQCMVCHMHPGTNMVATYLGYTWWDNETDGKFMYPSDGQIDPSQNEEAEKLEKNPEASSLRGKWSDPEFLQETGTEEFNSKLDRTRFADSHGHGWLFRAAYKKDRKGNLLDENDNIVDPNDPERFNKAVHLRDIHLEKGMHCADCHFRQDSHGDGNLYNEPRAAIEISCVDCHGSIAARANGITSGPAAAEPTNRNILRLRERLNQPLIGADLTRLQFRNDDGKKVSVLEILSRDEVRKDSDGNDVQLKKGDVVQNSMVGNRWWKIKQTVDTVTPCPKDANGRPIEPCEYNSKSAYAKTMQKDNETWGNNEAGDSLLAHADSKVSCTTCHTSWMTSCFGCHLSMEANRKMPNLHNEGGDSRNYTSYNYQVIRDDVFMLGKDGTVTGHRVMPVRSSSAVLVSSRNQNREWIYSQQQTVSAEGFSGQAFNTHVPHTVRSKETKQCSDCHVSDQGDNNAWLAQVMLQGTNFVNFMGRYVYVAATDALEAVAVTEHTEPQAVYGSNLHKLAYRDNYEEFVRNGRQLKEVYENKSTDVLQVQVRGEYAYVAAGKGGLRIYDIAQIDHKGFSERIVTAPVSPLGQKFYVKTKYATAVAAPTTLAVDPARWRTMRKDDGSLVQVSSADANRIHQAAKKAGKPSPMINEEEPIHPLYAYLYVADREEGLILVNAATVLDGDPRNNFLKRALTFNPGGVLNGSNNIVIAGNFAYITTSEALVVVGIDEPLSPRILQKIPFNSPKAIAIQYRYAFVVDADGLSVLNISDLNTNGTIRPVNNAKVTLKHAKDIYVARTYAYVANGEEGLAIIDVEKAESPRLVMNYDADGVINDAHAVKLAMTNASLYAYIADGRNGLRVLQMTDPETMPEFAGFSPRPMPKLIATFKTKGEAVGISKGLDRDRAVDESGTQIAVFGRRGARPFNLDEIMRMQRKNDGKGEPFEVSDSVKDSKSGPPKSETGLLHYLKSLWVVGFFGVCFVLVFFKIGAASRLEEGKEP